MKSQFANVAIPEGCSIHVLSRRVPEIPFEWHYHSAWELTLTLNSRGSRFIADHIGKYDSHDLVLVPSGMPHTWASAETIDKSGPHVSVVVWFTEFWASQVVNSFPEYSCLRRLLKRAIGALSFSAAAGEMMESHLTGLLSNSARERIRSALDVLTELAEFEAVPLATPQKATCGASDESVQLQRILGVLHERFAERIRILDLCAVANMSERSLQRLFVRHLHENLTDYLCRLRIGRACMWLVETDRPINIIAADSGFPSLSNFNRRFRAVRHMSPTEFRGYHLKHGSMPESYELELLRRPPVAERSGSTQLDYGGTVLLHAPATLASCGL